MDHIDRKIDTKGDWLYGEMREMEIRICKTFDAKIQELDKNTELKFQRAKDIEDERFKRFEEGHREHERRLDTIDRDSYDYHTTTTKGNKK